MPKDKNGVYNMRRTKIVCTLGPATKDDKILRALIDNGMNGCPPELFSRHA